ncbi:MAG: hypothetical protein HY587_00285, partial [Candidatus Omnitrophica bacterium]|nr:hypothetical protein [Candidatus Omnitrophota bacterium]
MKLEQHLSTSSPRERGSSDVDSRFRGNDEFCLKRKLWFRAIAFTLAVTLPLTDLSAYAKTDNQPDLFALQKIQIPAELGSVQEIYLGKGSDLIIHIQDAHGSVSTQESLGKLVKFFHENHGIKQIFVEGGEDDLPMQDARTFPDAEIRAKVAAEFLKEWKITGTEYYIISENPAVSLVGIENLKGYYANREQFVKAMETGKRLAGSFDAFKTAVRNLESRYAGKKLREFLHRERKVKENTNAPLVLMDHLRYLRAAFRDPFESSFPLLNSVLASEQNRTGANFSAEPGKMMEEFERLHRAVRDSLVRTEAEKIILELWKVTGWMEGLVGMTLGRSEFEELSEDRTRLGSPHVRKLFEQLAESKSWKLEFSGFLEELKFAVEFYEGARNRDHIFVEKSQKELKRRPVHKALLITGGFHTAGITSELRQKNISYVVVQPHIEKNKPEELEKYRASNEALATIPLESAFGSMNDAGAETRRARFYKRASFLLIDQYLERSQKRTLAAATGFGAEKKADEIPSSPKQVSDNVPRESDLERELVQEMADAIRSRDYTSAVQIYFSLEAPADRKELEDRFPPLIELAKRADGSFEQFTSALDSFLSGEHRTDAEQLKSWLWEISKAGFGVGEADLSFRKDSQTRPAALPPGFYGVEASLSNIDGLENLSVSNSVEKLKERLARILKKPANEQKEIFEGYRGFLSTKANQSVLENVLTAEVLRAFRQVVFFDRGISSFPVEELYAVPYIETFYEKELRQEAERIRSEVPLLDDTLSHKNLFDTLDSSATRLTANIPMHQAHQDQVFQELRLRLYRELLHRADLPPREVRIGLTASRDGQQSNYALRFSGAGQRRIIQLESQLGALHDLETWGGGVVQAALLKDTRGNEPEDPWFNLREQTAVLRQELEEILLPHRELVQDEDWDRLFDRFVISDDRRMMTGKELEEILSRYPPIAPNTKAGTAITDRYKIRQEMLLRGQYIVGLVPYPDSTLELFIKTAYKNGVDIFRIFDALNDRRNIVKAIQYAKSTGAKVQPVIHYSAGFPKGIGGYVELAQELILESGDALDSLVIKDAGGLLEPDVAFDLVHALRADGVHVPIHLHTHDTRGNRQLTLLEAIRANGKEFPIIVDLSVGKSFLSAPFGQPDLRDFLLMMRGTNWANGIRIHQNRLDEIENEIAGRIAPRYPGVSVSSQERREYVKAYMPGGMATNFSRQLKEQLKGYAAMVKQSQGIQLFAQGGDFSEEGTLFAKDLLRLIREEMPFVTRDAGNISLVTPTSQWVGVQAFANVVSWLVNGWIHFDRARKTFTKTEQFPVGDRLKQYAPLGNDLRNYFLVWSQDAHLQSLYPAVNRGLVYRVFEDLKDDSIGLDAVQNSLRLESMDPVDTDEVIKTLRAFGPIRDALGKTLVDFTVIRIKQKLYALAARDGPLAGRIREAIGAGRFPRGLILEVIQGDHSLNVPLDRQELIRRVRKIERKPMVFGKTPEDVLLWSLFPQQVAHLLDKREHWLDEFQGTPIGSDKRETVAQTLERLGVEISLGGARRAIRYADHWIRAFLQGNKHSYHAAIAYLRSALDILRPFTQEGWPEAELFADNVYEKLWIIRAVKAATDILNIPLTQTQLPSGALQPTAPGLYLATEGLDEGERHINLLGPLRDEVLVVAPPRFHDISIDKLDLQKLELLRNLRHAGFPADEVIWRDQRGSGRDTKPAAQSGFGAGEISDDGVSDSVRLNTAPPQEYRAAARSAGRIAQGGEVDKIGKKRISGNGASDIRQSLKVWLLSLLLAPWSEDLLQTWYQISFLVGQNTQPSIKRNIPKSKAKILNSMPSPKKNWLARAEVTVILLKSMNVLATRFFLFPSNRLIGLISLAVVQLLRERKPITEVYISQVKYDKETYFPGPTLSGDLGGSGDSFDRRWPAISPAGFGAGKANRKLIAGGAAYGFAPQGTRDSQRFRQDLHRLSTMGPLAFAAFLLVMESYGKPNKSTVDDNAGRKAGQLETFRRNESSENKGAQNYGGSVHRDLFDSFDLSPIQPVHAKVSPRQSLTIGRLPDFFGIVNKNMFFNILHREN